MGWGPPWPQFWEKGVVFFFFFFVICNVISRRRAQRRWPFLVHWLDRNARPPHVYPLCLMMAQSESHGWWR